VLGVIIFTAGLMANDAFGMFYLSAGIESIGLIILGAMIFLFGAFNYWSGGRRK
jgi:hypothetical protein